MVKLELTEEEAGFVYDRCFNKAVRLEEAGLADARCHDLAETVMTKVRRARQNLRSLREFLDDNDRLDRYELVLRDPTRGDKSLGLFGHVDQTKPYSDDSAFVWPDGRYYEWLVCEVYDSEAADSVEKVYIRYE
jgi:hypothetical protein